MVEGLGAGIALDESLDFTLTPDGDIASTSGAEELNKDIGFQLNIILDQYRGAPLTSDVRSNIKSDTVDTILSDSRVRSVNNDSVRIGTNNSGTVKVIADYITVANNSAELVFEL